MSRRQKDPLRPLSDAEKSALARLSRSQSAPAAQVARARALLAVAEGQSYTRAAQLVGRHTGDTVARWVAGFNRAGLAAVVPRHGGGHPVCYGEAEQRRILAEVARAPERVRDGTATWSLATLRNALRRAEDAANITAQAPPSRMAHPKASHPPDAQSRTPELSTHAQAEHPSRGVRRCAGLLE